jgi:hypothetical protein
MQFRVGINIGEVICDEARIYGDGINRPFAFVLANHNVRKRTGLRRLQQTPARRETTILDDSGQYLQLLRRIAPPTHDLRRL